MIIIEGPDNTGKTTLINQLVKNCGLKKAPLKFNPHDSKDVPKLIVNFYDGVIKYLTQDITLKQSVNIVWDRLYFSELVYGPLKRGTLGFTPDQEEVLPELIKYLNPLVIICITDLWTIKKNLKERKQYMKENEIEKVVKGYVDIYLKLEEFTPYYFLYNYPSDSYNKTEALVKNYLNFMNKKV